MPQFHNLLFNPFYEKHDHELVGDSRKELMSALVNEIEEALSARAPFILTLLGAIGVGKSFTLKELSARLNDPRQLPQPSRIIAARFDATIAGPSSKYVEYLFHSMMKSVGKAAFEVMVGEFLGQFASKKESDAILSDIEENFKHALLGFDVRQNQNAIWNWLTGAKSDFKELKKLGINAKIDNPSMGLEAFGAFSTLLQKLGYAGVVLCIDEAEELALSGTAQVVKILTQIKKVFEQNKNQLSKTPSVGVPIVFCLAFTPGTYRLITGARTAEKESERTGSAGLQTFLRRIGREYFIDPLTSEEVGELVKVLLNVARKEQSDLAKPFNKDALKYLARISHGVPGYVMEYAKELLTKADYTKERAINEKKAQDWLVEAGLIPVEGISPVETPAKEVEI